MPLWPAVSMKQRVPSWPAAGVGAACVLSWPGLLRGTSFDYAKHRTIVPGLQYFRVYREIETDNRENRNGQSGKSNRTMRKINSDNAENRNGQCGKLKRTMRKIETDNADNI